MKTLVNVVNTMILAIACALLAGCSQGVGDQKKIAQLQGFLQKQRSPVWGIQYRVMPPDVICISSQTVKEVSSVTQQVRPDGKISLPLIGDVFVAGLTPQEIRQEISTAAQRYYKKVDITVVIAEYNSQKIFVFGEVYNPGPMPWTGSDTLLDVLARCQPTTLALPEKIKVIRARCPSRGGYLPSVEAAKMPASCDTVVTNKNGAQELTIDLMAMVKTGDMSHNIMLQPDDVVYVPQDPFVSVGMTLQKVLFPTRNAVDLTKVPADVDNNVYLHWKYRDRYINNNGGN